jgi:glycosyltransferase involved in cell wall biosynthesis
MHIGWLIYGHLELQSGGFLYDRQIVAYLRAQGDTVSVISLPWRSYARSLLDNFSLSLLKQLKRGDWDVIVQDELVHPSLIWINRYLHRAGSPPLVTLVHLLRTGSQPWPAWQNCLYGWVERRYLESVDGAIYVSENNRHLSKDLVPATPPGIVAYPAGDHLRPHIDLEQIAVRASSPGPLKVLFVGNLIPRKGLHTLVEALASLQPATWELTVIGDPAIDLAYGIRIRNQVERNGLDTKVHFLGALPNTAVGPVMAESDILAMPSYSEGYAIVYLEALAHGLPVIATIASGAPELIQQGENGFLVQPGDAGNLAAHLRSLCDDRAIVQHMSLAARQTYDEHPTWSDAGRQIREYLLTFR